MSKEKLQIKRRSMFGEVMVRFLRKPIAVFGAVIMIVVVALCLLAPVIAPYGTVSGVHLRNG